MKISRLSIYISGLLGVTPCSAQPSSTFNADQLRAAAQFVSLYRNELDCENVGYVQTGEADEHFAPIFHSYDHDQSRSISLRELLSDPYIRDKKLLAVTFSNMDRNADGSASAKELLNYLNTSVKQLDGDGDGDVYPDEFEHARKTGTVLKKSSRISKAPRTEPSFITPQVKKIRDMLSRSASHNNQ
jgi:hypothetical protein